MLPYFVANKRFRFVRMFLPLHFDLLLASFPLPNSSRPDRQTPNHGDGRMVPTGATEEHPDVGRRLSRPVVASRGRS